MKLTVEQQHKAEENMGLVGKVLADKVHGRQFGSYTREDLYQIGCIGLCKAAATDKGGCFSTYAYRLIWNEICNALVAATSGRTRNWSRRTSSGTGRKLRRTPRQLWSWKPFWIEPLKAPLASRPRESRPSACGWRDIPPRRSARN